MSLRINTNVSSLMAHNNMVKNDGALSSSLEKLSSGLRINKASDDASGLTIADALKSQGMALGQAVQNAGDAISLVQTADGALQESVNIVNTIKTKSMQAAQDGQTTDSRKAIQSDISKLLQELDSIAKTTSFNGQKLLSGNFTNKQFQVGAYSGQTANLSIGSSEAAKIGQVTTSNLTFGGTGKAEISIYSNLRNETYTLNSVELANDNSAQHGMSAVADGINKLSDVLGMTAQAVVTSTTNENIHAGTTASTFAINGVSIGSLVISENDSDGALVASINDKTSGHGVFASVGQDGKMLLTSTDGRAISITADADTKKVLGNTADLSTLGKIVLTQMGTGQISVSNRAGGQAIALVDNALNLAKTTNTTVDSNLAADSVVTAGSTIAGGKALNITGTVTSKGNNDAAAADVIGAGSTLKQGAVADAGTTLNFGTLVTISDNTAATQNNVIGANSTLLKNSVIDAGTTLSFGSGALAKTSSDLQLKQNDVIGAGSVLLQGTVFSGQTTLDFGTAITISGTANAQAADTIGAGSTLAQGTTINSGMTLNFGAAVQISGTMAATGNDVIGAHSIIAKGSTISASTTLNFGTKIQISGTSQASTGDIIGAGSILTRGTKISGETNFNFGAAVQISGSVAGATSDTMAPTPLSPRGAPSPQGPPSTLAPQSRYPAA